MKYGPGRPCRHKNHGNTSAPFFNGRGRRVEVTLFPIKMKHSFIHLLLFLCLGLLAVLPTRALSEELDLINRPMNASGLTGLLVTTSPFTLETGVVETGVAVFSENSKRPDYTLTEYAALIAIGTGKGTELAVRGSSFHKQSSLSATENGRDIEAAFKWNFSKSKPESPAYPAFAMIIAGIAPTGDQDMGVNRVHNWGARFGLSAGNDIGWREHILSVYIDALMTIRDLSDTRYRDRYQTLHAGMLLPISKYRNLQLFIEYAVVSGKEVIDVDGLDYSSFIYGLRLVSERLNLTIGTQFLHKDMEGFENTERIIGMLSVKF
jgi:hypothetical protein